MNRAHLKRHCRNQKNIKSADKAFRKQTLESLEPLLQLNWRRTLYDKAKDFKNIDECMHLEKERLPGK